jgi:hypothetical protein
VGEAAAILCVCLLLCGLSRGSAKGPGALFCALSCVLLGCCVASEADACCGHVLPELTVLIQGWTRKGRLPYGFQGSVRASR